MIIANRHSNDSQLIWIKNTTKAELKKLNIKIYTIASKGYDYYYQISKNDLPIHLKTK